MLKSKPYCETSGAEHGNELWSKNKQLISGGETGAAQEVGGVSRGPYSPVE